MKKIIPILLALSLFGCESSTTTKVGDTTLQKSKKITLIKNGPVPTSLKDSIKKLNDSMENLKKLVPVARLIRVDSDTIATRSLTDTPYSVIIGGDIKRSLYRKLTIYKKGPYIRKSKSLGFGKFEYWITDASSGNFRYVTDRDLKVGDEIKIEVK